MRNSLFLLFLLGLSFVTIAQQEDLELWGSLKFTKKVSKKGKFEFEEQVRWSDSISSYKKSFTNLSYEYKLHKRHAISINLRHTENADNEKFARFCLDLQSDLKLYKKIMLLCQRIRVQKSWDERNYLDKFYFRAKWGLVWKGKFASPYLDQEFFWKAQNAQEIDKQRTTFGLAINISSQFRMKFFVRKQRELNRKSPDQITVIGFGSHYKF
jgi:hypothetical protein